MKKKPPWKNDTLVKLAQNQLDLIKAKRALLNIEPMESLVKLAFRKKPAKKGWKKIARQRNKRRANKPDLFNPFFFGNPMILGGYARNCDCDMCVAQRGGVQSGKGLFEEKLKKHGFKRLGSGLYSSVYGKDNSNRVLKITKARDNWYDYVTWARESGWAGKFAPMVYSYKKVKFKGDEFYVASMERMSTAIGNLPSKDGPAVLASLITYHQSGNPIAKQMISSYNPDLGRFFDDFFEKFKSENRFDLHGGNMMLRDDQSFCLTDPICGERKTAYKRLRERDLPSTLINLIRGIFESSIRYRGRWTREC